MRFLYHIFSFLFSHLMSYTDLFCSILSSFYPFFLSFSFLSSFFLLSPLSLTQPRLISSHLIFFGRKPLPIPTVYLPVRILSTLCATNLKKGGVILQLELRLERELGLRFLKTVESDCYSLNNNHDLSIPHQVRDRIETAGRCWRERREERDGAMNLKIHEHRLAKKSVPPVVTGSRWVMFCCRRRCYGRHIQRFSEPVLTMAVRCSGLPEYGSVM